MSTPRVGTCPRDHCFAPDVACNMGEADVRDCPHFNPALTPSETAGRTRGSLDETVRFLDWYMPDTRLAEWDTKATTPGLVIPASAAIELLDEIDRLRLLSSRESLSETACTACFGAGCMECGGKGRWLRAAPSPVSPSPAVGPTPQQQKQDEGRTEKSVAPPAAPLLNQPQKPMLKGESPMRLEDAAYRDACVIRGVASFASLSASAAPALHALVKRDSDEMGRIALMLQRLPDTLAWHHLTGIECDHATRTDVSTCGCALWRSAPQPSVGAAVDAWVSHVIDELRRPAEES